MGKYGQKEFLVNASCLRFYMENQRHVSKCPELMPRFKTKSKTKFKAWDAVMSLNYILSVANANILRSGSYADISQETTFYGYTHK